MPIILIGDEIAREKAILGLLKQQSVSLEHPDVLFLNEKLGVEAVKKIREHLFLKPALAKFRMIILNPADSLTIDAQNSLLKILEEPSETTKIILGVNQEESLILTIRSRCEIQHLAAKVEVNPDDIVFIEHLLNQSTEQRLELIEKREDKKELIKLLLFFYQKKLGQNFQTTDSAKLVLQAERWSNQNVSPKSILDYLMLALAKQEK